MIKPSFPQALAASGLLLAFFILFIYPGGMIHTLSYVCLRCGERVHTHQYSWLDIQLYRSRSESPLPSDQEAPRALWKALGWEGQHKHRFGITYEQFSSWGSRIPGLGRLRFFLRRGHGHGIFQKQIDALVSMEEDLLTMVSTDRKRVELLAQSHFLGAGGASGKLLLLTCDYPLHQAWEKFWAQHEPEIRKGYIEDFPE